MAGHHWPSHITYHRSQVDRVKNRPPGSVDCNLRYRISQSQERRSYRIAPQHSQGCDAIYRNRISHLVPSDIYIYDTSINADCDER